LDEKEGGTKGRDQQHKGKNQGKNVQALVQREKVKLERGQDLSKKETVRCAQPMSVKKSLRARWGPPTGLRGVWVVRVRLSWGVVGFLVFPTKIFSVVCLRGPLPY